MENGPWIFKNNSKIKINHHGRTKHVIPKQNDKHKHMEERSMDFQNKKKKLTNESNMELTQTTT